MSRERDERGVGIGEVIVVTVVVIGALLLIPGLLLVYAIDQILNLDLDRSQVWCFGAAAAFGCYSAIALGRRGWGAAVKPYLLLCGASLAVWVLSDQGFHTEWPRALWHLLIPR